MSVSLHHDEHLIQLQRLAEPSEQEKLQSDEELVSMFVDGGSREALERLIERYAPMVASVCRLTVADPASAEDAFQATFLVLLKSAKKIQSRASVGAWLHGVAYRMASRLRKQTREQLSNPSCDEVIKYCEQGDDPVVQLARHMELETLNRELENLPERLRAPLVEHYLLGFTAPQIAERMELSTSAVEGRLKRGRRALRTQLAKRGISMSVLLAGSLLFQQHLQASEAAVWTGRFLDQHLSSDSGVESASNAEPIEAISNLSTTPQISSLVQGEISMFSAGITKVVVAASVVILAGAFAVVASDGPGGQLGGSLSGSGNGIAGSANAPVMTMPALDTTDTVVAQYGGGLGGGFGGGAATSQANAPAVVSGAPGANVAGAVPVSPKPIPWQRPDASDGPPVWLAGGVATVNATEKNRAVLAQETTFDYHGESLRVVVDNLSEETGFQFVINETELDAIGLDQDTPISGTGKGSIRAMLKRILTPHDLVYKVSESCIFITSVDDAERGPTTRFYDLAYILPNSANVDSLTNAIQQSIDPDGWLQAGGMSTIVMVGSMMVASCPDSTHERIEIFLHQISKMNPKNIETAPPLQPSYGMGGGMGGMGGGMGGMGGGGQGGMF